jgi:hypothetical protein
MTVSYTVAPLLLLTLYLVTLSALPSPPERRPCLSKNVIFGDQGDHLMVFYLNLCEMYVCAPLQHHACSFLHSIVYELDSWEKLWEQGLATRLYVFSIYSVGLR